MLEDIFIMLLKLNGSLSGYKILMESSSFSIQNIILLSFCVVVVAEKPDSSFLFFLG